MGNTEDITVLSLCTGYGGLEPGLHRALGRPLRVVAVEIEAFAAANLVAKAEEGKLAMEALYPDLKTFPAERFSGCFDFILAGYPCQPFSVAGKRKGEADPRHLWPFIRNHIQQIRPLFVFLENVAGHLRLGFDRVVRDLDELGYRVEAELFTAAEVGSSMEKNERLFILAQAKSVNRNLLLQPRKSRKACIDAGGASEVVEQAVRERHKHEKGKICSGRKGIIDASFAVAPQGIYQNPWEEPRVVESGMGRTVDGFASRVDELRLLGNGVVPAQAELAFRILYKELIK